MIVGKKITDKLVRHLDLIEKYLNSIGLDVSIKKTVSKSMDGDWIETVFLTERYDNVELDPSNFQPLFKKTFEKTSPALVISYNDIYGEVNISPVCLFKKTDYKGYYKVCENLKDKIKKYIDSTIDIEIRQKKLNKI